MKYTSPKIIEINEPFRLLDYDGAEYVEFLSEVQKQFIDPKDLIK